MNETVTMQADKLTITDNCCPLCGSPEIQVVSGDGQVQDGELFENCHCDNCDSYFDHHYACKFDLILLEDGTHLKPGEIVTRREGKK